MTRFDCVDAQHRSEGLDYRTYIKRVAETDAEREAAKRDDDNTTAKRCQHRRSVRAK